MNRKRKMLLFAYIYPPLAGPPVFRPLKMVKYLSKFGWDVDVITVKNITYHSRDYSLLKDDLALNVFRTNSFDPMSMLSKVSSGSEQLENKIYFKTPEFIKKIVRSAYFIDDKIGWYPFAYQQASKLCKNNSYDVVMATMAPFSAGVIAENISRKYKIPLIVDFRDYWTQNSFLSFPTALHRKIAERWEKKLLTNSLIYLTTSKIMGRDLSGKYNLNLGDKNFVMYNGWDKDDFESDHTPPQKTKYISYLGTLYGHRTPEYFLNVLKKLKKKGDIPKNIIFRFVGNFYDKELQMLNQQDLSSIIEIIPQVEHNRAIELMMESAALLIFNPTEMGDGIVPGKVFECLRTGKEIFSMIAPNGEVASILRDQGHDLICEMECEQEVEENLLQLFKRIDSNPSPKFPSPSEFSRENQTIKFLEKLESCLR